MKKLLLITALIGTLGLAGLQVAAATTANSGTTGWGNGYGFGYCGGGPGYGMGYGRSGGRTGSGGWGYGGHMMGW